MTSLQRRTVIALAWFLTSAVMCLATVAFGFALIRDMQEQTRGVAYPSLAGEPAPMGVNVALEQYSNDDAVRALALIRNAGLRLVRQHFYWSEIEPRPGEYQWTKWDRIVANARQYGVDVVAVLDTTPVWARDPGEADLPNASPANVQDYAQFVQAFVRRYSDYGEAPSWRLYVQLWDNPNVHPYWGRRNVDPAAYTALLRAGAIAARSVKPGVKIISAGLAPNAELIRGHPDYSDVLFLRGMYEAGARDYFDILGAKPYGMWTGPDDRRVSMDVFNWSRAILLREEMTARGDGHKSIWAVEFGWNALPADWDGKSSPWGTDKERIQSQRLVESVRRARNEWNWMGALVVQTFQPNAAADDPTWGFALVDKNWQPRASFEAIESVADEPSMPVSFDWVRFYTSLAALIVIGFASAWRGTRAARNIPWTTAWGAAHKRFAELPEIVQLALLAGIVIAFYYSRNAVVNLVFLALVVLLFSFKLDLALAITVLAIPFYLIPKNLIGSMQFSLVEILTWAAVVAWGLVWILGCLGESDRRPPTADRGATGGARIENGELGLATGGTPTAVGGRRSLVGRLRSAVSGLTSLDWAVIAFVVIGIVSTRVASNFGVASREFRVIVLEPALLYALIRTSNLTEGGRRRLVDAFVLSALAVSLIGLYQFLFTDYVIVGEGVRRVLAVYGSPNNLALFLERALPVVAALVLFAKERRSRIIFAIIAIPVAVTAYLTFSRGAWLLGLPTALLFLGFYSSRRTRLAMAGLVVIGGLALIPFLGTERARSLFETGTGTGFFRISVWESGLEMLRDHPVFGVGLDNFLYEYPKYIKPEAWREPNLSHPHNIVLDFWLRMGILGVGMMFWMVFEFYRKGKSALRFGPVPVLGLMAGMTAGLAHGLIDAAFFYVDLAFVWMLMLALIQSGD